MKFICFSTECGMSKGMKSGISSTFMIEEGLRVPNRCLSGVMTSLFRRFISFHLSNTYLHNQRKEIHTALASLVYLGK